MTDLWGTLSRTDAHGTVELAHAYPVTPDELWPLLTEPQRLARWFAPVTGHLVVGGDYLVTFDDDPDSRTWGTIQRCDPEHELCITWQSPGDESASLVTVTLDAVDSGTLLRLVHSGLPHQQDVGHAAGWEVYLRHVDMALADAERTEFLDWESTWTAFWDAHQSRLERASANDDA